MDDNRNETIAAAFDRLFRTYQQSDRGDPRAVLTERMERAKIYFEAVAPFEVQDIEKAVENFLTGNAPGHNAAFAPPAPFVAAECRRVMNQRLRHERLMRPALPPPADPEITPEQRERGKGVLRDLAASLAWDVTPDGVERSRRRKEDAEKELRWLQGRGDLVEVRGTSVPVSRALISQISTSDPDGDREVA